MSKKVAVAVIHGMGSQGEHKPDPPGTLSFSSALFNILSREMGDKFHQKVVWREIFWSDIMEKRQKDYLRTIKGATDADKIRGFVVCNLSDAASYRKSTGQDDDTYEKIHATVTATIDDLAAQVDEGTPLVILAHSLGGHIMSNYIYDMTKPGAPRPAGFRGLRSMAAFVTFGCNIPIFTFAYPEDKVAPIKYPGVDIAESRRLKASWWRNYYDRDDVLGYPLRPTSPQYGQLKGLKDIEINAGNWYQSWNPLSHNQYWTDREFYQPLIKLLNWL
jgi:hypothetical protein